ncbi:carbohydrate deacetylase [Xylocopilactobacillus apicola]|uniref:Carbohydrate deacetylase n=1 Tax=Xylocopilactobacillus apicola TaxID=2932184 RepID=A0AAU9DLF4_9LACO|nr:carbohydrate deacetylase [Xylocopilactobacillus apicola]BDR57732.1 carbohydrate deacetylase [Xylocopilactobacillus apicola]
MKLLIVNADDFGYCPAINLGIIESFQQGILSSTTIMAGMPGFNQAVKLAKENPKLGVGVHLTLTCQKPVLKNVPSLVESDGNFHKIGFYEQDFSLELEELYQEWKAQIEKVIASGIIPDHLDSHHHVHTIKPLTSVFEDLAAEYDLPVRGNYDQSDNIKIANRFYSTFDNLGRDKEIWKPYDIHNLVEDVETFGSVEAMCHPGYLDSFILEGSSLTVNRTYTMKELKDPRYPKLFEQAGIQLGTYCDL